MLQTYQYEAILALQRVLQASFGFAVQVTNSLGGEGGLRWQSHFQM